MTPDFIETPEQLAARLSVRAFHFARYREDAPLTSEPVKDEGCDPLAQPEGPDPPSSNCARYSETCEDCGKPTGKRLDAKRCAACKRKRFNEARKAKRAAARKAAV